MSIPEMSHADDPVWLAELRSVAHERAVEAGLPSAEEEQWRYSPIDEIDLSSYYLAKHPHERLAGEFLDADSIADAALVIDTVDGFLTNVDDRGADGVVVIDSSKSESITATGTVLAESIDTFADANLALSPSPLVVSIAANVIVEGPIVVRHHIAGDGGLVAPRLTVVAGENSQSTVIEVVTSDEVEAMVLAVTELSLAPAARLDYLVVQNLATSVWQIASQVSSIDRDARLATNAVALGGGYARLRTDTRMVGRGAEGNIMAVYLGGGDQSLDLRTFQTHVAPNTRSNLEFRGAVDDRSRSIYTGLIRIEPDAGSVEAYQTNRTIKLSDGAWAESVPNLEIENDDVKCSHASAVGPIDAEQRFYLESRGVPTPIAERLVVQGFFSDIVARMPHSGIAAVVEAHVADRLQGQGQR
ncbi:MAG: Fe-S cluster assembly protein SufD [Actinomycetia bacterium]|nr:Fe-S cluster assembly protein SufD [Actinomycetes bacterium]MCP4958821.1 Fe-S cluster assembly protein SufD [Actinomycetes bacterium]